MSDVSRAEDSRGDDRQALRRNYADARASFTRPPATAPYIIDDKAIGVMLGEESGLSSLRLFRKHDQFHQACVAGNI